MGDIVYVVLTLVFFVLTAGFISGLGKI